MATYAIDFDGYLCENAWPEIGEPHDEIIDRLRDLRHDGNKLILWTCREGELLKDAVAWCLKHRLFFDAINDNLPENSAKYGGNSRKIFADYYCDDKNCDLGGVSQ